MAFAFLLTAIVGLLLTVVVPLVSLIRAAAAREMVSRLERRVEALEAQLRGTQRSEPSEAQRAESEPSADSHPAPTPEVAPQPIPQPIPQEAAQPSAAGTDSAGTTATRLETRIGTRWMLYVGVTALVIGVGLFVRYAFANQWVTEPLRVAFGAVAGFLVFLAGHRAVTAGHARFGTTLVGGGVAIWYLTVYAALNLYGLLNPTVGFGLLIAVTGLAAIQADRLRSPSLATVAVLGGFSTPFLIGGDADSAVGLFSYTALLIGAIVYLAHRRDWPGVTLLGFVLTGVTVPIWHSRLSVPDAYLTTEFFFTGYAALFLWVRHRMRGSSHPHARWVSLALWTTPAWYHLASLVVLTPHRLAFLVYLIIATGVGVVLSVRRDGTWTRLVLWAAATVPLFDWSDSRPDESWLIPTALSWLAIAGVHLAAQVELIRRVRARLHAADVLLLPATGLGLFVGLHVVLAPSRYALTGAVAAVLAVGYAAVGVTVRRLDPRAAKHVLVVAVTLAVVAIGRWLGGEWTTMLLTTQGAGMVWVGLGEQRRWVRGLGAFLLGAAITQLLELQFGAIPAAYAVILNQRALLGFFVVAGLGAIAWWYARWDTAEHRPYGGALATTVITANVLMLVTLSTEIHAFWEIRASGLRFGASAEFIRQMMLSATWGAYAAALTAAGFKRGYAPIRYLAIAVFGVTVVKVFTVDFSQLDSIYRIVSSLALGLLLVGASYLYQRHGASAPPAERDTPGP